MVQKGKQMKFMAVKKNEKTFWFCDLAVFKDSAFTAVKRDTIFQYKVYERGTFSVKAG